MQQSDDVLGRRIAAGLIDLGITFVLILLVGGIFGDETAADAPVSESFGPLDRLLVLVLVFGYFWSTEAIWAQTLGKRAMRIRVERVDGSKATVGATFVRTLLRAVDGLLFYVVGLLVILATGSRRQRLGDMAAKTRVVAVDESPADDPPPPPPPDDDEVLAQVLR
ncbi:MAG: RDD family protein [Solirubrobacteraceae bacterium]|nr:RDD family protein [Solirubrobacteraceae bacterium]